METQHEFIERRRLAHEQAALEAEQDPLIRELFGPREPIRIMEWERRAYCFEPGFMLRRQAGDPLDPIAQPVNTVTQVSVFRGSYGYRRRYPLRLIRDLLRAVSRIQRVTVWLSPTRP